VVGTYSLGDFVSGASTFFWNGGNGQDLLKVLLRPRFHARNGRAPQMPRRAALLLLLLGGLAASAAPLASAPPSPPSLAGRWQHRGGAAPEQYVVAATADALVYNASCVANGCTTWQRATVSVTDAAARAALIVFTGENGRNHTGVFAQDWLGVTWSDGSAWERPPAPQPLAPGVTGVDVVVMPHTHDDAGWQRTFEGYYEVEVTPIINNVVAWLTQNLSDSRVFNWVESSFLQRWWLDQNATTRATFAQLVALRRIVFVGGGWTSELEKDGIFGPNVAQQLIPISLLAALLFPAPRASA